jgi:hypothetical protein
MYRIGKVCRVSMCSRAGNVFGNLEAAETVAQKKNGSEFLLSHSL